MTTMRESKPTNFICLKTSRSRRGGVKLKNSALAEMML
jgi:hypothetical protein